jgi:hypothetical protein
MKKKYNNKYEATLFEFESITDFVNYLNSNPLLHDKNKCSSIMGTKSFTNTKNYEEAEDLLLHGWSYGTEQIKKQISIKTNNNTTKKKNVYSVQGFQACVPRYLQGLPDSMIYSKQIPIKNKVIVINKNIGYNFGTKTKTILEESVKCLKCVQELESQGYKVQLNVILAFGNYNSTNCCYDNKSKLNGLIAKVCVKKASQRLNLKQVAFPLLHPSMLRRMIFRLEEIIPECKTGFVGKGYGRCTKESHEIYKEIIKGEYMLPMIVDEQEIVDIEKYKVQ